MSRLTIFAPDLFANLLENSHTTFDHRRWPVLALMISRAREHSREFTPIEDDLGTLFGPGRSGGAPLSVPDLTASIDKIGDRNDGIMRADPVHLRADPTQILLFNDPSIMPSPAEADALIDTLNTGLPELNLRRGRHPGRWYCDPLTGGGSIMAAPGTVNGRSIANFLPRDQGASTTVQIMNEAQMLLHDVSVNSAREASGVPPINAIWIWGAQLSHTDLGVAPRFVVGDDVLTAAIAERLELDWCAETEPKKLLLNISTGAGDGLLVLGSPTGSLERNEPTSTIDDFEQLWGPPVLKSLRRFRLAELCVVTDRQTFTLTPLGVRKFWRRQFPTLENNH